MEDNKVTLEEITKKLRQLDVSSKTKEKNGLTFLSWSFAIDEALKIYPELEYSVKKFNDMPFIYDDTLGYMVFTEVTILGNTREMWLPVLDGANKPMKKVSYKYTDRYKREKTVNAADMFDINKAIMRCLVKNIAMFGLGLYIYAGEDLPEAPNVISDDRFTKAIEALKKGLTTRKAIESFELTAEQTTILKNTKDGSNGLAEKMKGSVKK